MNLLLLTAKQPHRGGWRSAMRPTARLLAVSLPSLALMVLAAGCGSQAPFGSSGPYGSEDPDGKILRLLRADPVLAFPPAGATLVNVELSPAQDRQGVFDGGAQEAPAVIETFTSTQGTAIIYTAVSDVAVTAGWRAARINVLGVPDLWHKVYPSGLSASLSMDDFQMRDRTPGVVHHYALTVSEGA